MTFPVPHMPVPWPRASRQHGRKQNPAADFSIQDTVGPENPQQHHLVNHLFEESSIKIIKEP